MCNPLTSATCIAQVAVGAAARAAGQLTGGLAGAAVGGLAGSIQKGIATVAADMVAWWIKLPSPNLTTDPVPHVLQAWLFPFTAGVALIGIITAAGRMVLTRKSAPLVDVGSGLLTIAVASAVGTLLPTLLLQAGDAYSNYVLQASTGGQFPQRFVTLISLGGTAGQAGTAAILIVVGTVGLLMAAIQAILLLFRQGAVILLAGMLPLAAAGTMTSLTRPWLKRVTGWSLAMIFYKPAAASVYAVAFLMIGQGSVPRDPLVGFAFLLLSLIALPALMRFFTWTTGQVEASSGGGVMGAVIGGAAAVGALRGYGGMSPSDQARAVTGALGSGPGAAGPGQGSSGPDQRPSGPGGAPGSGTGPGQAPAGAAAGGSPAAGSTPATGTAGAPASGAGAGTAAGAGAGAAGGAVPSGAAASGAAAGTASAASAAAPAGAAAAAGGPVGMVVLGGAQAARGAATRLADGAAPPGGQS